MLGGSLGVDAIEEFSVITSNYEADYGKTSGGVVNAITRSGTNQIHGSAYEFLRNSKLDAKNYFDDPAMHSALQAKPVRRNHRRADRKGPHIFLRRLRRHSAVEGHHNSGDRAVRGSAWRHFVFESRRPTPVTVRPHTVTVDPAAQAYFTFYHLPNQGAVAGSNGDLGIFTFAGQQVVNENFLTARVDHKFSAERQLVRHLHVRQDSVLVS